MALSREEQETIIRLGYNDENLTLTTTNPAHARRMEKMGFVADVSKIGGEAVSWIFRLPGDHFKLPRPKKKLSDLQRQAAAERMRAMRTADDEGADDED